MVGMTFAIPDRMMFLIAVFVVVACIVAWIHEFTPHGDDPGTAIDTDPAPTVLHAVEPPAQVELVYRPYVTQVTPIVEAPVAAEEEEEEEATGPWFDDRACWGCDKRCTYRKFRVAGGSTADEIKRLAESKYRAEHGGYASDLAAMDGDTACGERRAYVPSEFEFDPIAVARRVGANKRAAWDQLCEDCGTWIRAGSPAFDSGPSVVDGLDVVVEGSPF